MSKFTLPRETNIGKVVSTFRASRVKYHAAKNVLSGVRNVATLAKRRERTLAAWAQSRKVRFVRLRLSGAKRSILVKAARSYFGALAMWRNHYNGKHGSV